MKTLAIDFETYYSTDYSMADMGAWAYCNDPRFDAYLVAAVGSDGYTFVGHPSTAPWEKFVGEYPTWISHNAAFDEEVFLAFARQQGPLPAPRQWHCTADLMAFLQYPRALQDGVWEAFGVALDKGIRERMKSDGDLFPPTKEEVDRYALADAKWCLKLWQRFSSRWPDRERQLSAHTRLMGRRGIGFDRAAAVKAFATLGELLADVEATIPWVSAGLPPTSRTELFRECSRLGLPRPVTTAENHPAWQKWLDQHEKAAPWVRGINTWRKLNRTREVIGAMLARSDDTRLHYSLKYYGAATGRWSGGEGLNLQNLNSRGTAGGIDLRGLLIPGPGKIFIISDLSQIEPRCMAVISGDDDLLDGIRSGLALYEAHARATMGWAGGPLKSENPRLYALAKARVLGLSYGAGAETFVRVAKMMAGLDLTLAEAEQTVVNFRESNKPIVRLWDRAGKRFAKAGGTHCFTMPLRSGRLLRYFSPTSDGHAATQKGKQPTRWWGSKLVENLIQATARDVLADMVLAIEAAGIPVVLTVHDEVVCEVPTEDAQEALEKVRQIMSTPPEWMPTLPVACESKLQERYGK